jgi:hypothetical protein
MTGAVEPGPVTLLLALLFAGKDQFDDVRSWAWLLRVGETGAWGVGLSVGLVVVGALSFVAGPSSTFSGARFRRSRRSPVMPGPASSRR